MQLKFKATGRPFRYEIDGEKINGFDFSIVEHGGEVTATKELREAGIRKVERDENGELWVTLCQAPPVTRVFKGVEFREGDWTESDWIDAGEYDPDTLYIKEITDA